MEKLITKLRHDYPNFTFISSSVARWSPQKQEIAYKPSQKESSTWSVLHELGHALLNHTSYGSDLELLQKELEAWEKAKILVNSYGLAPIDENHIQNCLDTYRDWLYKRSRCPYCQKHGVQHSKGLYSCLNCGGTWKVSSERFCRPYRLRKA